MTVFIIIDRKKGEPHDPLSIKGIACQVANIWLRRSDAWQTLQAIEPNTKYATFESMREMALCQVLVDDQRAEMWREALAPLYVTLDGHRAALSTITAHFYGFSRVFDELACAKTDQPALSDRFKAIARLVWSLDVYNLEESLFECLESAFEIEYCQRGLELSA